MNSEVLLDIAEGPACLTTCLSVPEKTMMGPGPTNCTGRVLHSLSLPVLGHLHPETTKIMDNIKEGIRYMFQTKNQLTLALSASGHGGMEAVLCNLLEPGQRVLCGVTGIWSQRAAEMAKRYGAEVFLVEAHIGEALTYEQVRVSLDLHRPQVFFVTQGDSSTGVLQPIEGLADICHSYNCLLAVDTVASLGGTPMFADRWGVDAIYTGSQKVLGAPPGLAPISFSLAATAKIFARKTPVQVYYWDMTLLGDYWGCFDRPRIYHHTISATLLYGLREALAQACDEGLMSLWVRHNACAKLLYKGLQELGIQLLVKDENVRLPTITTFLIPEGADVQRVTNFAMRYCSLEISGGLGPTAGNVFRIGLLGPNATEEKVDFALRVLKEALRQTKTSNL